MRHSSVPRTSDGSHATTARSGKAMPQFEETPGADKAHRYGSDWLVSGKRQYDHQVPPRPSAAVKGDSAPVFHRNG